MSTSSPEWALKLFRRSVLKQQKWKAIASVLGPTEGLRCLDIGSDNGVISYLLRAGGGRWASADLDEQAVASIRSLVGSDVVLLNGGRMPFADAEFDRVVLVDCLEHVQDDRAFMAELLRIARPGGEMIFNVPLKKESWLRRVRHAIGQTDEAHGHLRSGYTPADLQELLGTSGELIRHQTYSRFFSEAVDTLMTWAIRRTKGTNSQPQAKGTIVTSQDLARHRKLFALYTLVYPFLWAVSQLDRLLWFRTGYMLIARARVHGVPSQTPAGAAR